MRHIVGKLSTSSFQRYKVCANRSSDEGVMAPGSRGVGAVFVHSSDAKIPVKRGMLIGEPRVPRRSRSHYLSNAPGLADQLVASRKDSAREGGSCAAYFCKVPDSRESELGLVRYGPASRVHRGVFGPFEGSFPIRIPADPDKFLAIREFHVVHGCVLFPMCPGSQINLLRVRKTLCASVATSVEKFPELSAKPYFALHRGELGFARYDPANGGRRNVPYAKGGGQFDPVFGLVNGPVKPWSNLVNLGQTWSNLVKALQTLGRCIPDLHFKGFWATVDPSRAGNGSYPPRLGDLDAVTFDYIPGEDMWRLLLRIEDIWGGRLSEMVLIEEGSPGDSSVTSDFVEWREGWTPFFTLRPTVRPGAPYSLISRSLRVSASTGQPERVTALERELEEAQTELLSLRLARASEREASAARVESLRSTLHHNSVAVANIRRDLVAQRGNVSTLRTMNEFIREQLEISEDAKEQLEETLAEAREQLETEQAERTRVQDELDSLRSYTQALVDPATGRPQDIVALRRALDASEEALTSARTSMGVMRVQISVLQGDNGSLAD
uniref:Aminotransferase-like plant mobile domain-containing protein n=1 Tax=Fagus sylvatica TaxID=28930 RepID=A0A2N9H6H1_FAGSY